MAAEKNLTETETENEYISLQEAAQYCNYSQEYLSLRARHGKLKAVKLGRNWVTKKEWLQEYLEKANGNNNSNSKKVFVAPFFKITAEGPPMRGRSPLRRGEGPPENLPIGAGNIGEIGKEQSFRIGPRNIIFFFVSFFIGLVLACLFFLIIFAAPPTSPYNPGVTLSPTCVPDSENCTVYPPVFTIDGVAVIGEDKLAGTPNIAGAIKLFSAGDNALYTTFTAATQTANANYTLPTAMPGSDMVLQSTAAGVLAWVSNAAGGAPVGEAYVTIGNTGNLSAERALTGTTNQITVTDGGANSTVTLSTPQDIHTAATPQFAGLGVGVAAASWIGIYQTKTRTTDAVAYGGQFNIINSVATLTNQIWGVYGLATKSGASSASSDAIGLQGLAGETSISNNSITVTGAAALHGRISTSAGTARAYTNAYGVYVDTSIASGGSIGTLYGFYMPASTGTTRYGVYIADTGAGNTLAGWLNVGTATTATAAGQLGLDRLYLNSTAYLDGASAGVAALTGSLTITKAITAAGQTHLLITDEAGGTISFLEGETGAGKFYPVITATSLGVSGAGVLLVGEIPAAQDSYVAGLAAVSIAGRRIGDVALAGADLFNVRNYNTVEFRIDKDGYGYIDRLYLNSTAYLDGAVGGTIAIPGTGGITLGEDIAGGTPNTAGTVKLFSAGDNAFYTTFTAATQTANATYTLPIAMPGSNMVLQSTSGGALSWVSTVAPSAHSLLSASHGDTTTGTVVRGDIITGQGVAPAWAKLALGTAGKILRSDGTDLAYSTSTFADTYVVSTLLYASSANIIAGLATANSGVLVTGATGIPSIATDIPTAVTIGTAYIYRVGGTDVSVADGGTGRSVTTAYALIAGGTTTTAAMQSVANSSLTGAILQSAGTSAIPTWSTTTYPATNAINTLLYASSANVMSVIAAANSSILVTGATGIPSLATDIPTAVTIGTAYIYRVGGTDVSLADGGTGASLTASTGGIVYSGASALAILSGTATANKVLMSGASAAPVWSTPTFPNASATSGKVIISDATNWIASTTIWPNSITDTYVLVATGVNTITGAAGLTFDDTTNKLTVTALIQAGTAFQPDAANGADLGTTALEFANLYIGTGRAYFGAGQERSIYNLGTTLAIPGLAAGSGAALQYSTSDYSVYYVSSSERYKEDIKPFTDDFLKILQTEPKSFTFKASQQKDIGYIAEDFQELGLTNLLLYDAQGLPASIKYEKISLYLVEVAKLQQQQIEEIKALLNPEGAAVTTDSSPLSFLDKLKQDLAALGLTIENGIVQVKELIADKIFAKKIRTNELEMVDKATGEIYCTWIENGEWQKVKGECQEESVVPPPPPSSEVPTSDTPPAEEPTESPSDIQPGEPPTEEPTESPSDIQPGEPPTEEQTEGQPAEEPVTGDSQSPDLPQNQTE